VLVQYPPKRFRLPMDSDSLEHLSVEKKPMSIDQEGVRRLLMWVGLKSQILTRKM